MGPVVSYMSAGSRIATTCDCTHPENCVDRQVGRYLLAIYRATLEGDGRARTGEVSDRVGVSPATVTETFERLDADGLVDYEKHRGVDVTERGVVVASDLAVRTCTVRRFFETELGVAIPPTSGYRIGFVLPEAGIEQLRQLVDPEAEGCCHEEGRDPTDCSVAWLADGR